MSYRPHPFTWCPSNSARHATAGATPDDGDLFDTLCGESVTADRSAEAWFSQTCTACDARAHQLAGSPMPPAHFEAPLNRLGARK